MKERTYIMKACCCNCDEEWQVKIQKGILVCMEEKKTICKHCGCDNIIIKPLK